MDMLVKMAEVLVKIAVMMMPPAAFRRHRKQGGESPPSTSSSLTLMTHKCRESIVVLSISKSVKPNEERKEMISNFQ